MADASSTVAGCSVNGMVGLIDLGEIGAGRSLLYVYTVE